MCAVRYCQTKSTFQQKSNASCKVDFQQFDQQITKTTNDNYAELNVSNRDQ